MSAERTNRINGLLRGWQTQVIKIVHLSNLMAKEIHLYGNILPQNIKDKYFFTILLNKKGDGISFDNTIKGHRILKQINVGKIDTKNEIIREEWDTFHFASGKFKEKIHEKWVDKGKDDVINGIIYKQVWEIQTPEEIDKLLLEFNNFLWENKENLSSQNVQKEVERVSKKLYKFSLRLEKEQSA